MCDRVPDGVPDLRPLRPRLPDRDSDLEETVVDLDVKVDPGTSLSVPTLPRVGPRRGPCGPLPDPGVDKVEKDVDDEMKDQESGAEERQVEVGGRVRRANGGCPGLPTSMGDGRSDPGTVSG